MEKQPNNKPDDQLQPFSLELDDFSQADPTPVRAGSRCPKCGQGILDYDGLLVLRCPLCDFAEGGCFT